MNGVSRPMAGHESVDAKVAEEKQERIHFNTFFSIPSLQYPLEGCARRVPLRGTQRKPELHNKQETEGGNPETAQVRFFFVVLCDLRGWSVRDERGVLQVQFRIRL